MKKSNLNRSFLSIVLLVVFVGFMEGCSKSSSSYNPPSPTTPPAANQVIIQNMTFNPGSMSVAMNTTVTWVNKDAIAHTVTSNTGVFDSGNLAAGASFSFKFTEAGTFAYHCTIHPNMTGTIVVH